MPIFRKEQTKKTKNKTHSGLSDHNIFNLHPSWLLRNLHDFPCCPSGAMTMKTSATRTQPKVSLMDLKPGAGFKGGQKKGQLKVVEIQPQPDTLPETNIGHGKSTIFMVNTRKNGGFSMGYVSFRECKLLQKILFGMIVSPICVENMWGDNKKQMFLITHVKMMILH